MKGFSSAAWIIGPLAVLAVVLIAIAELRGVDSATVISLAFEGAMTESPQYAASEECADCATAQPSFYTVPSE